MFWRFGFSSTSTLDTLLERPNVTLEEVLDEEDLLQELKSQNTKLLDYLQQPRVLKRLLEHVVGTARVGGTGGKDWEEKVKFKYPYIASEVLSCDNWVIYESVLNNAQDLLEPFWNAVLTAQPAPSQAPLPIHSHPLFSENTGPSPRLGVTNLPETPGNNDFRHPSDPDASKEGSVRSTTALENGPGRSVLAGYWAKVNGVFLEKQPLKMFEFIQSQPKIVERFVGHLETPAVVDLLFRIIQAEESLPYAGVLDWFSSNDLISRTVDLLAPNYSIDLHNTVSELLKAIIALSAPSPASLNQGQASDMASGDTFGQQNVGGINNRLVRELASEATVHKMVGFMLEAQFPQQLTRRLTDIADDQLAKLALDDGSGSKFRKSSMLRSRPSELGTLIEYSSKQGSALEDDDDDDTFIRPLNPREFPASESRSPGANDHRDSTATVRPSNVFPPVTAPTVPITKETTSSSLVTCISVFIELIRKNNSDYFEQHLFHTLRTHLLQRQQELADARARQRSMDMDSANGEEEKEDAADAEEDEEMEGMEEAMAEMAQKLGIVHLGPMLQLLSERLSDFQNLVMRPRELEPKMSTTIGDIVPLTFERYRITELYAELLHCSNMALLNRAPGEGPQYSSDGTLMGGIEGLQVLARTLQGGDGPDLPDTAKAGDTTTAEDDTSMDVVTTEDDGSASKAVDEKEAAETQEKSDAKETIDGLGVNPNHSRQPSGHVREKASTGNTSVGGASEDTEDEALLNEVSFSDKPEVSSVLAIDSEKKDNIEATTATAQKQQDKEADADAQSIKSALSGLSLAELTLPHPSGPPSPIDDSKQYVIGDLLKKKFLECEIIPSLLDLFFEYPWNNFLHNVVYDILQQFFNGRMDVGLNRKLTTAVFEQGRLTQRIIDGHAKNEESMKGPQRVRLGYMGHMNLIAEETVKLLERYPFEVARPIADALDQPAWDNFVNKTLRENREKEAGPLAGGRPSAGASMSFGAGDDDNDQGQTGAGNSSFASYLSSQIGGGTGGSDDDDSDEEASWLSHDMNAGVGRPSGFDDAFAPRGGADDQNDEWGPFADPSDTDKTNFDFSSSSSGVSSNNPFAQNLTPADWSAQFRREGTPDVPMVDDDDDDSSSSEDEATGKDGDTPFVDLLDPSTLRGTNVVASAHARRPSLTQLEAVEPETRRSSSSGSSDPIASQATDGESPLGPGVPADIEQRDDGMLQRTLENGTTVVVPLDEVALTASKEHPETN